MIKNIIITKIFVIIIIWIMILLDNDKDTDIDNYCSNDSSICY